MVLLQDFLLSEERNVIVYYWYSKYNTHKVPTYKHSTAMKLRNPESRGTMSFPQCLQLQVRIIFKPLEENPMQESKTLIKILIKHIDTGKNVQQK